MNFYEAMQADQHTRAVGSLTTLLRADDLPFSVQNLAGTVANQIEGINDDLDEVRAELATLEDFFASNQYTPEYARELTTKRNAAFIKRHDPEGAIGALESNIGTLLGKLAQKSAPVPPTDDPALLQSLLLGARQDATLALTPVPHNLAEAILNLQKEALSGSEDGLAYLLGATEWPVRFVKANSDLETQLDFDRIKGTLRDNVSDPSATPYRQAAERFAELDGVPDGYRVTWKVTLEESGLLIPEVASALGL